MNEHWATYQVLSGMNTGTYVMFLPLKSLADVDAAGEMHGGAYEPRWAPTRRRSATC